MKRAFCLSLVGLLQVFPAFADEQACSSMHIAHAPATAHSDNPACGSEAACINFCVSIPQDAVRTGWRHEAHPLGDGNWFRYTEISSNFSGGTQNICFQAKNWSDNQARDGSICIQFKRAEEDQD